MVSQLETVYAHQQVAFVIEDEPAIAEYIGTVLESMGFRVISAASQEEYEEKFAAYKQELERNPDPNVKIVSYGHFDNNYPIERNGIATSGGNTGHDTLSGPRDKIPEVCTLCSGLSDLLKPIPGIHTLYKPAGWAKIEAAVHAAYAEANYNLSTEKPKVIEKPEFAAAVAAEGKLSLVERLAPNGRSALTPRPTSAPRDISPAAVNAMSIPWDRMEIVCIQPETDLHSVYQQAAFDPLGAKKVTFCINATQAELVLYQLRADGKKANAVVSPERLADGSGTAFFVRNKHLIDVSVLATGDVSSENCHIPGVPYSYAVRGVFNGNDISQLLEQGMGDLIGNAIAASRA